MYVSGGGDAFLDISQHGVVEAQHDDEMHTSQPAAAPFNPRRDKRHHPQHSPIADGRGAIPVLRGARRSISSLEAGRPLSGEISGTVSERHLSDIHPSRGSLVAFHTCRGGMSSSVAVCRDSGIAARTMKTSCPA